MEIKEMLMYAFMTIACVAPVVWFARAASSKSRLILKSIKKVTGKLPVQHDVWTGKGMAFDSIGRQLVYVNGDGPEVLTEIVPADGIIDVQVLINSRKAPESKKTLDPRDVDSIQLQLLTADSGRPEYLLTFFNLEADGPFQANFHFQLARKWKKAIGELRSKHYA